MMRNQMKKEQIEIELLSPNEKKPKEQIIKFTQNLGWCPYDEKLNEQRINRMVAKRWETKGTKKKLRLDLGLCPNDEKQK